LGAAAAAVALGAVLLSGCGSGDAATVSAPPTHRPSTSATADAATSAAPVVSVLEGSWHAGPVSLEDTVATVRRHGLGRWSEDYRDHAPFVGDTVLTLTIQDQAWDLYGASAGGQPEPIDYDAEYEIDGDTVVFHHSDGSNTYRWEVHRDTLRLHFVRSTLPGYKGIPEEVFQRALYMTQPFRRQS
jgi:hypothetical protein